MSPMADNMGAEDREWIEAEAVTSEVTTSASPPPVPSLLKFGVGVPSRSRARAVSSRTSAASALARSRSTRAGSGKERRRRKRPSPTLALAPNHYTALAPLVDSRISIFFVHLRVLIIFIIAIRTPAVRDIGDEWRERDRVRQSVDNAAPTMAGDAAREHEDKEMGTALARASVSPGDLGDLSGAGVVGSERCVDAESSLVQANARGDVLLDGREARAASASGASPPARVRAVPARMSAAFHPRALCGKLAQSKGGTSGSRPTSPSPRTHSACGTGVGDASPSRPRSVTSPLPLLPLLNDRTPIVCVHPRGFVIFVISLLPCPS
ncbi:hypothetical protein B0H14DRAFT_3478817 [Mycena olivaceomarginata]|nr:hypothetical protein B0H14DRAFT_3478817 [Mycena olivaceomarginata]